MSQSQKTPESSGLTQIPFVLISAVIVFLIWNYIIPTSIEGIRKSDSRGLKLEHENSSTNNAGEVLTRNDGRLQSTQRGNVAYFYQLNATNDSRIPLRDHGAMLVAFESTSKLIGPVVSVSSEIVLYNGRPACMGMWVTFMPGKPIELPR